MPEKNKYVLYLFNQELFTKYFPQETDYKQKTPLLRGFLIN